MSSHHIVREKQEPALLVLDIAHFPAEQMGQLLEWSPTVITNSNIADELNSLGIKIDWIINNSGIDHLQADIKIIPIENDNFIETCLKHLIINGYKAVNIITSDFELKNIEYYADKINIVIFKNHKKIFAVSSKFSRWKTKGETIQFLTQVNDLKTEGLEKINENQYQTIRDGFFTIQFENKNLFIAEDI